MGNTKGLLEVGGLVAEALALEVGEGVGPKDESVKEEACTRRAGADDGFTASVCGLSGTGS